MLANQTRLLSRTVFSQTRTFAAAQSKLSLQEYQEKYRTSASDILAAVPHNSENNEDNQEKLEKLFAQYYDSIGAYAKEVIAKKKFHSSKQYEELYNLYHSKIDDFGNPMHGPTHFPLLNSLNENKVVTEENYFTEFADFLNVNPKERSKFDFALSNGELLPDDQWALDLQTSHNQIIDDFEDLHQDHIDAMEADFGSDNHQCDTRGVNHLLLPHPNQELLALEKKYMMTAEEVEHWDSIEEEQKALYEKPIETIPTLPEFV